MTEFEVVAEFNDDHLKPTDMEYCIVEELASIVPASTCFVEFRYFCEQKQETQQFYRKYEWHLERMSHLPEYTNSEWVQNSQFPYLLCKRERDSKNWTLVVVCSGNE